MPLEQTACRLRFYVKAVQTFSLYGPLLTGARYPVENNILDIYALIMHIDAHENDIEHR